MLPKCGRIIPNNRKKNIKTSVPDLLQPGTDVLGKYMKTKIATFIGLFLTLYLYYIRRLLTEFKFLIIFTR